MSAHHHLLSPLLHTSPPAGWALWPFTNGPITVYKWIFHASPALQALSSNWIQLFLHGLFLLSGRPSLFLYQENRHQHLAKCRTSQVVQSIRVHLPMRRSLVRSLLWEDFTCCGARKPTGHNCWSLHAPGPEPQLTSLCAAATEACAPGACTLQQEKLLQWEAREPQLDSSPQSLQLEKACVQQWSPSTARNTRIICPIFSKNIF